MEEKNIQIKDKLSGFLGFKPNFLIQALNDCPAKVIGIFTGNQHGKCFNDSEYLYTSSGIKLASKTESGDQVLGGELIVDKVFEDDLFEISFANGVKIKCNKEHPFWVKDYPMQNNNYAKFEPLDRLKTTQYVLFSPGNDFSLVKKLIPEAKLFGYLCSDGYLGGPEQTPKFTNNNLIFLKNVWLEARKFYPEFKLTWRRKGSGFDLHLSDKNHSTENRLKLRINELSISKESFGELVLGDENSIKDFLCGFFNGDGYLLLRKRKNGWSKLPSVEVGFCIGKSREKTFELQYMLWKIGIISWIISERMKTSKVDFWRVKVTGINAKPLLEFLDWTKYPQKFKDALDSFKSNRFTKQISGHWSKIKAIKPVGKGFVVPITTTSGNLYSYCGMKTHNTSTVVKHYIDRILGMCPIEEKNMRPNTQIRTIRFASETLPMEAGAGGEVRNTVYPQLKKFLPYELIKKDITIRKPVMTIKDPQGGRDIFAEFVSYNQEVQSQAGVQRWSIYMDEEPKRTFYDEQIPRLLSANGDIIIGMTPVEYICFDQETCILTKRGWKKYDEILMNDKVLSYSIEKDCYEWSDIIGFYLNKVSDDLFSMVNHDFDAFVTKGHKWVVENIRSLGKLKLKEIENINSKDRIKRFSKFNTEIDNSNYTDSFIKLVGWCVTDGSFYKNSQITIYQSKTAYPQYCNEIYNCLTDFDKENWSINEYEYNKRIICGKSWEGHGIVCHYHINYNLAKSIREVTNKKTINQDFICSLSNRQLNVLFETMIKGDGHRFSNTTITFSQTENFKLLEDFQLICTLLGLKTTIREDRSNFKRYDKHRHLVYVYSQGLRYSPNVHYKSLKVEKKHYDGFVWCVHTENNTLVMKRNNCISISGNSWTFDEIFERADVIYNSPTIVEYFKKKGEILERKQSLKDKPRIAVIRGATDDNPTLDKNVIDERFSIYDDIDTTEMRRYGVFHQSTGAIFKDFSTNIHVISREEHFSSGMPQDWVHARGVDFHEHTNWACGWIALSKQNEAFIYNEYNPSPDMMVTLEIAREIALRSKDCHFSINLVDPWMAKKQMNTGLSPLDDLNRAFYEFKREGLCIGGGYWQTWDTKSARGRDIIKERLKNSRLIGRPFANRIVNKGEERYLPTLWVLNNCQQTIHSFRNWRWQEWANRESLMTKDEKNKPQDKYSHFPITFECIFKHPAFSVSRYKTQFIKPRESVHAHYFQMR